MIDSIVMYPLDVMPLELGLNVLGLSSPELLFKFVEGLQGLVMTWFWEMEVRPRS